ncbi:hypothetical protein L202_04524 [Cryptococcus amylolentus CBS 6039]|uniref:Uncharacterized protein n=2 Tax=Cryptococcus amylolentus TaxID=104669 RepID=A0A1E3HRM4_9TREE|nr:hypothetical protein L202_04524 [Cryptococcus amylolentus CBS 6039]ODN79018.1 hypothetical protein L202_04524 [Cryptococcus amylolentus CBS 6039]ODO06542.1 hypothetical protein I350_03897 [Cryptococcus amylolentus CBS 6273]
MNLRERQRAHREKKRELQSKINELSGQSQNYNFTKLRAISIKELQKQLESLQSHGQQPGEGGSRDSTMEGRDTEGGEEVEGEEGEGEGDDDDEGKRFDGDHMAWEGLQNDLDDMFPPSCFQEGNALP